MENLLEELSFTAKVVELGEEKGVCNLPTTSLPTYPPTFGQRLVRSKRSRYSNRTVTYSDKTVIYTNRKVKSSVSYVYSCSVFWRECCCWIWLARAGSYDVPFCSSTKKIGLKSAPSLICLLHCLCFSGWLNAIFLFIYK